MMTVRRLVNRGRVEGCYAQLRSQSQIQSVDMPIMECS